MFSRLISRSFGFVAAFVLTIGAVCGQPGWAQQYPDQQNDPRFQAAFPGGDPPGRVGRLSFVSNSVSLRAYGDDQWSPATINYPITTGTAIWTEPNALAEIRIGDAAIRMNNATELEFIALDDQQVHAYAKQGGVNVQIRSLRQGDRFEISTPRGTVSLSGRGNFRIDAGTENEPTRVAVFGDGTAHIYGEGPDVTVRPGEVAFLTGTDTISYDVRRADLDSFDRWAMARDPIGRPVLSARYVPPEMTGYEDLDNYGSWNDEPDYGPVWYPRDVPVGWVPYRNGHWSYVWPWGYTWIDDAQWGFAPFHYGRWVVIRERWCWFPGPIVPRPIFAPALVAFIGFGGFSVSIGIGPAIGWFPLGPLDPFQPWYRASPIYLQQVNIINVTNIHITINNYNYGVHPHRQWATVVGQEDFARGRPIRDVALRVGSREALAQARVMDLRSNALPPPVRDRNERVQRAVGTPPPVNFRGGAVPGIGDRGNRNRDANIDRNRNDDRGRERFDRGPADRNNQLRFGDQNNSQPNVPRSAGPGAPSPRSAPFNQDRFERFRTQNPNAFGTPPGQNQNRQDGTPSDRRYERRNDFSRQPAAIPPRRPEFQPGQPDVQRSQPQPQFEQRQQNPVDVAPARPPEPQPFQRQAEPPRTFPRPENFQRRDDSVRMQRPPEVERPRPQPQFQNMPRPEFRQPQPQAQPEIRPQQQTRQEFRPPPQPQQQRPPRGNDERRRDRRGDL